MKEFKPGMYDAMIDDPKVKCVKVHFSEGEVLRSDMKVYTYKTTKNVAAGDKVVVPTYNACVPKTATVYSVHGPEGFDTDADYIARWVYAVIKPKDTKRCRKARDRETNQYHKMHNQFLRKRLGALDVGTPKPKDPFAKKK